MRLILNGLVCPRDDVSIDAETIARRYAVRPGCRFVGCQAIGIAVFSMNIRALALEPRQVPPIDEFLLRFMLEDIDQPETLAELLGLDYGIVQSRLVELRRLECIDVAPTYAQNNVRCSLTIKGRELARSLKQTVMQEITIPDVIFHGLLRKPVQLGNRQYLRPKEAKEEGRILIRAIPNRYPHPEEIDVDLLNRVVKGSSRFRAQAIRDIVAIKNVLKMVYTLYEPAFMLEYDTDDERRERQVAFIIDGQERGDYELAFANARGPELLAEILTPKQEPIQQRVGRLVSKEVINRLGNFGDVEELASRFAAVQQRVEDARQQFSESERNDTRERLRQKVEELEKERDALEKERNSRKVRFLWTPEIRQKLWEAVRTAEKRLLILSGFISSDIVNQDLETELRIALNRGVQIWIGYGFDKGNRRGEEQRRQRSWQEAEGVFKRLSHEFPKTFILKDVGRSHEKRLICDNLFTFGGSFNLLSFTGEARRREKVRHEGADLIEDSKYCEELYSRYIPMFFS